MFIKIIKIVCLNLLGLFLLIAFFECFFRLVGYDFGDSSGLFKSLPIFYRQPVKAVGEIYFQRPGPDQWTGKVINTGLRLSGYSDKTYQGEQTQTIRYDKDGFRNPTNLKDWEIVVVGDSFTELGYLPYEDLFTTQLGKLLRVKVRNLGVSYTGPLDYIYFLQHYGKSSATKHAIMVFFEGNDINDLVWVNQQLQTFKQSGKREYRNFTKQSSLIRAIYDFRHLTKNNNHEVQNSFFVCQDKKIPMTVNYAPSEPAQLPLEQIQLLDFAFAQWAQTAKDLGMEPWVVFMPSKERALYGHIQFLKSAPDYVVNWKANDLPDLIHSIAKKYQIDFIDLTTDLVKETQKCNMTYNGVYDTHLNKLGSMIVAKEIANRLREYQ